MQDLFIINSTTTGVCRFGVRAWGSKACRVLGLRFWDLGAGCDDIVLVIVFMHHAAYVFFWDGEVLERSEDGIMSNTTVTFIIVVLNMFTRLLGKLMVTRMMMTKVTTDDKTRGGIGVGFWVLQDFRKPSAWS